MNIIKIENIKRIQGFTNKIEISSNYKNNEIINIIVILSEEDVNNDNCLLKLKGYRINVLLIPKKYRYTFLDETPTGKLIKLNLDNNYTISYF